MNILITCCVLRPDTESQGHIHEHSLSEYPLVSHGKKPFIYFYLVKSPTIVLDAPVLFIRCFGVPLDLQAGTVPEPVVIYTPVIREGKRQKIMDVVGKKQPYPSLKGQVINEFVFEN